MGLCHNLCRAFPLNACHSWFNLFLKDCCLRHTEAQVNGNYFYIVYRQMLWAVKTDALSLILYWVSVIVSSCFMLTFAISSVYLSSNLHLLLKYIALTWVVWYIAWKNHFIAKLLSFHLRWEQAQQQMCWNSSEFKHRILEEFYLPKIFLTIYKTVINIHFKTFTLFF